MFLDELEEALSDILPGAFHLALDKNDQVVIYTGLIKDDDGELSPLDDEDSDPDPPDGQ